MLLHEYAHYFHALLLFCVLLPAGIAPRLRRPALTLLAAAFVLVMDNINAVLYLTRLDLAKTVFDGYRINVALVSVT